MADDREPADFDWLYRSESSREPAPEPTAVMPTFDTPAGPRTQTSGPSAYPQPQPCPSGPGGPGGPPGPPPVPPSARAPRKKGRAKRVISALTVLVVAWVVFMIGTPIYAWSSGTTIKAMPTGARPADQPGTTVLLVGSDSREDLTPEERKKLGTGSTEGRRTDTMMMLYIPPSGKPALISLPRDSYLPIPGRGKNKLNAAYAFGGAPLLIQTVEQNTGVRIDAYLEVGFLGIVDAVDALGGIEVCLAKPIKDRDSHLDLPAGCQTLNGTNALGYVRMRKADPTGDIGRMQRQREVIGLITKKAASPATLLNPVRYWNLNMAASKSLVRDEGTGLGDVANAALSFKAISSGDGYTLSVPVSNPNAMTPAGSSMIWDSAKAKKMFGLIASGTTNGLAEFEK